MFSFYGITSPISFLKYRVEIFEHLTFPEILMFSLWSFYLCFVLFRMVGFSQMSWLLTVKTFGFRIFQPHISHLLLLEFRIIWSGLVSFLASFFSMPTVDYCFTVDLSVIIPSSCAF